MRTSLSVALLSAAGLSATAVADPVIWTDWTSSTGNVVEGTAGAITVQYVGEVFFTQLDETGFDYWHDNGTPYPAYTGGTAGNTPYLNADLIAISGNGTVNTVFFGTPVANPYMALVSLGQPTVGTMYHFDAPFVIDSQGPGYWGSGTLTNAGAGPLGGHTLLGFEGHGVIRFIGTFSSISWSTATGEEWNAFTFGIPTPGAAALLGLGAAAALRRRR